MKGPVLKLYHTPTAGPVPLILVGASTIAQELSPLVKVPLPARSVGSDAALAHTSLAAAGAHAGEHSRLIVYGPAAVPLPWTAIR